MSIEDQRISDKIKWEERQRKRKELNERRKTEGKKYEIAVDYQIRMDRIDEHFARRPARHCICHGGRRRLTIS